MTNEATRILYRIKLQDHIETTLSAAQTIITETYVDNPLVAELHDVAEYLRELYSLAEGSI